MEISLTQLIVGFQYGFTDKKLAVYLGADVADVRARLRQLTEAEEDQINKVMEGEVKNDV